MGQRWLSGAEPDYIGSWVISGRLKRLVGLGGVLTLNVTILSWDAQSEEGTIGVRLGIADMGSSCEFTSATTTGALTRTDAAAAGSSTEQYEI